MEKGKEHIVLTLNDNKKYVLVNQIFLDNLEYYYLAEVDHPINVMFCQVNGGKLTRVTDEEMIRKIVMQIYQRNHSN